MPPRSIGVTQPAPDDARRAGHGADLGEVLFDSLAVVGVNKAGPAGADHFFGVAPKDLAHRFGEVGEVALRVDDADYVARTLDQGLKALGSFAPRHHGLQIHARDCQGDLSCQGVDAAGQLVADWAG